MTLLEQLRSELPTAHHFYKVYLSADVAEAERIAGRVRELVLRSVRYVMSLAYLEPQPPDGHPKRAAYDILIAALDEVTPRLAELPAVERSGD